ncbi:hypothetical protein [Actinokineospora bangkokensis]|uniref:hypothetical protein n=1 Tax=Actinokineospora bangkokensis TaxID=1193682 RepID=UPI0038B8229C
MEAAAVQLGVSSGHVRDLTRSGQLITRKVGRSVLISADSVARRIASEPARGRPLAPRSAWTVLLLASGLAPPWTIPASEKVRLARFVRRPLRQWSRMLARRAETTGVRIPAPLLRRVRAQPGVALGGIGAAVQHGAPFVQSAEETIVLYLTRSALDALREQRGIGWGSTAPNAALCVVDADLPLGEVFEAGVVPVAVAAADLLDLGDDRSSRAAAELLGRDDYPARP